MRAGIEAGCAGCRVRRFSCGAILRVSYCSSLRSRSEVTVCAALPLPGEAGAGFAVVGEGLGAEALQGVHIIDRAQLARVEASLSPARLRAQKGPLLGLPTPRVEPRSAQVRLGVGRGPVVRQRGDKVLVPNGAQGANRPTGPGQRPQRLPQKRRGQLGHLPRNVEEEGATPKRGGPHRVPELLCRLRSALERHAGPGPGERSRGCGRLGL